MVTNVDFQEGAAQAEQLEVEAKAQPDNMDSQDEVAQAEQLEAEAQAQPDLDTYTHKLKKPFTWEGRKVEELHFDWGGLTGRDYTAIEDSLLRRGVNLIVPEYTGGFLCGMAVRACTDKDAKGARIVDEGLLQGLPLRDYKAILGRARFFFSGRGNRPGGLAAGAVPGFSEE